MPDAISTRLPELVLVLLAAVLEPVVVVAAAADCWAISAVIWAWTSELKVPVMLASVNF